jgi:hypothetical protein
VQPHKSDSHSAQSDSHPTHAHDALPATSEAAANYSELLRELSSQPETFIIRQASAQSESAQSESGRPLLDFSSSHGTRTEMCAEALAKTEAKVGSSHDSIEISRSLRSPFPSQGTLGASVEPGYSQSEHFALIDHSEPQALISLAGMQRDVTVAQAPESQVQCRISGAHTYVAGTPGSKSQLQASTTGGQYHEPPVQIVVRTEATSMSMYGTLAGTESPLVLSSAQDTPLFSDTVLPMRAVGHASSKQPPVSPQTLSQEAHAAAFFVIERSDQEANNGNDDKLERKSELTAGASGSSIMSSSSSLSFSTSSSSSSSSSSFSSASSTSSSPFSSSSSSSNSFAFCSSSSSSSSSLSSSYTSSSSSASSTSLLLSSPSPNRRDCAQEPVV